MPTARLLTLGCKVNQYETQYVKEMLESAGYVDPVDGQPADLCVINTCTVTHEGDAKSRQTVRRLHQQNPDAPIVVMGCYATRDPDAVRRLPGVTNVVADKGRLLDAFGPFGVVAEPAGITRFDGHQRAFVKVQDGCLLNCSYCIIPSVRPTVRSRPVEEIAAEVSHLVESGYREVVLTGIHLGHYGLDLSRGLPKQRWSRLWHLLDRLCRLPDDFRVRLSSLEAAEVRDDLVRVLAREPRICAHLHLCLQSGSNRILAAMKRRYRVAGFLERCRRIRAVLDEPALTTDIIIGFPGETDGDFEATCQVVRDVAFAKLHIFSYSPRAGTPAASLTGAVPPRVVAYRREKLRKIGRELEDAYCQRLVGRTLDVIVEGQDPDRPGHMVGTACRAVTVSFAGSAALRRQLVRVRATGSEGGVMLGNLETPDESFASAPARAEASRFPLSMARG